jgi:hypothetical protein
MNDVAPKEQSLAPAFHHIGSVTRCVPRSGKGADAGE